MNQYRFWELVQQGELQQAERVMISQYPTGVGINRIHSAAICSEIGERLRGVLIGDFDPILATSDGAVGHH